MKRIHVSHPRRYFTHCVNVLIEYIHEDDKTQTESRSIFHAMRVAAKGNTNSYTSTSLREQNRAWLEWLDAEQIPYHFEGTYHYEPIPHGDPYDASPEWQSRWGVATTLVHLYDRDHAFETRLRFNILRVNRGTRPIDVHTAFRRRWDMDIAK
ncbi:MAG: hypothetical protein EOP83_05160 [Verrucomicrobiaceae bacterium]|nr:MAG: hypothetical protein EOP83_05160 [Verrucomicrobiaceae bacterium]